MRVRRENEGGTGKETLMYLEDEVNTMIPPSPSTLPSCFPSFLHLPFNAPPPLNLPSLNTSSPSCYPSSSLSITHIYFFLSLFLFPFVFCMIFPIPFPFFLHFIFFFSCFRCKFLSVFLPQTIHFFFFSLVQISQINIPFSSISPSSYSRIV